MQRSTLVRAAIFLGTVVAAWAVLSLGAGSPVPDLDVGAIAERDYVADRSESIEDEAATERAEQEARDEVERPFYTDTNVEQAVYDSVEEVFESIGSMNLVQESTDPEPDIPTLPTTTTTTTPEEETTTTTTAEESSETVVNGRVYLDANGDGVFDPDAEGEWTDTGLANVTVSVTSYENSFEVVSDANGEWSAEYEGGPVVIEVDTGDSDIPQGFLMEGGEPGQLLECDSEEPCEAEAVGFAASLRPVSEVAENIQEETALPDDTVMYLATVVTDDLVRAAFGEPQLLTVMRAAANERVTTEFGRRITPEDLNEAQRAVRANPPQVLFDTEIDAEAGAAVGEIVASRLQANYLVNVDEYERLQEGAAEGVEPMTREVTEGDRIVAEGEELTEWHIAAINQTRALSLQEQSSLGLLALIAVLVALVGVYLATFRPEFWARPRMVSLLGIMVVLAATAVRGTVALEGAFDNAFSWYMLPAVAFGFITAVLFDQRIAILMALSVGVLTAAGTLDTGVTVYASLAALAPIPFVSAISTRGAFRNAVVLSSGVAAVVAAATSWYFHVGPNDMPMEPIQVVGVSVAWAFGVSVLASLLGLAILQFFESAFDITTTLGLLDLTDRNHDALQMLQEKAFGTFNHSLMVGTLADAAARSIGANALLARAMAYYHDLGKTENPTFFIENQFGMTNPHDDLDPTESARIIRDHVSAGVGLAREYKIPTEVTEGIVSHHGDGVVRYFYEKARQLQGDEVDIADFRHIGHKPRTPESAILMLADSLEAACRAVFHSEEPTPDSIEKVVDRVMNEKMEDGQLSESPLTLGQISKVRRAFLDSLVGHYHQRIAYPNFPGS